MAAFARKAPITHFDPKDISLRERSFNAAVAFKNFYTIRDKERLFKAFEGCLQSAGDLLFADYSLPDDQAPNAKIKKWFATEPVRARLWTVKRTVSFLSGLNFEVRVAEDITADYRRRVLAGWFAFVDSLTKTELTPHLRRRHLRRMRILAPSHGRPRQWRRPALPLHVERLQDRRS